MREAIGGNGFGIEHRHTEETRTHLKTPQENSNASELQIADVVLGMAFPSHHQSSEVVKPREQPLDLPATAIAVQLASVLGRTAPATAAVESDQAHRVVLQHSLVQRVAVVGSVADQSLGHGLR